MGEVPLLQLNIDNMEGTTSNYMNSRTKLCSTSLNTGRRRRKFIVNSDFKCNSVKNALGQPSDFPHKGMLKEHECVRLSIL